MNKRRMTKQRKGDKKKKEELVSVIISSYERPDIVKQMIDSIKNQTWRNLEIFLVNDGSTKEYPVIKGINYIKNEKHLGTSKSRNLALEKCKGEYIFVNDDDIILKKDYIKRLYNTLKKLKHKNVVAVCGRLLYPLKENCGITNQPLYHIDRITGDISLNATRGGARPKIVPSIHVCALWKADILKKFKFAENGFSGNYNYVEPDLCLRFAKAGYKVAFEPRAVGYHYQQQTGGARTKGRFYYRYATFKNYMTYCWRNFGLKALYMIPAYLFRRISNK